MRTWLKNTALFSTLLLCVYACSTSTQRTYTHVIPPCELEQKGSLCFVNVGDKSVTVTLGDTKKIIEPDQSLCLDLTAGTYSYGVSLESAKWNGSIETLACSTTYVDIAPAIIP